jgi:hypothetical protein
MGKPEEENPSLQGSIWNCPRALWIALSFIAVILYIAYFVTTPALTNGHENPVEFLRPDCPSQTVFPFGEGNVFTGVVVTLLGHEGRIDDEREEFLVEIILRKNSFGFQWSSAAIKGLTRNGNEHFAATDPILCMELCKASHLPFGDDENHRRQIKTSCDYSFEGFKGQIVNRTAQLYVSTKPSDCIVLGAAFDEDHRGHIHCHGRPVIPVTVPERCEDPRKFDRDDEFDGKIPVGNSTSCWFQWDHSEGYAWILKENDKDEKADDSEWPTVHGVFNSIKHVVIPKGDYWWLRGHRRLHQDTAALVVTYKDGSRHKTHITPLSNSLNGDAIPF